MLWRRDGLHMTPILEKYVRRTSLNNEREWCSPQGTTEGDTFERSMVKVLRSLMCDGVFKGIGSEGVASFMATSIRIIFVFLHEYCIA